MLPAVYFTKCLLYSLYSLYTLVLPHQMPNIAFTRNAEYTLILRLQLHCHLDFCQKLEFLCTFPCPRDPCLDRTFFALSHLLGQEEALTIHPSKGFIFSEKGFLRV